MAIAALAMVNHDKHQKRKSTYSPTPFNGVNLKMILLKQWETGNGMENRMNKNFGMEFEDARMEWKTIFHTRFWAWYLQKNIYE